MIQFTQFKMLTNPQKEVHEIYTIRSLRTRIYTETDHFQGDRAHTSLT